jgi:hypothetical protein
MLKIVWTSTHVVLKFHIMISLPVLKKCKDRIKTKTAKRVNVYKQDFVETQKIHVPDFHCMHENID